MQLSRSARVNVSSNAIRKMFLDYFCGEKDHRMVRSSPVLPWNDPTLAFCNAGMNQFKSVLLGAAVPPAARVANSQKCCRVGGKHNDLADVGKDGTHHTFFEMLGNWSFGDYFKEEACEMAWELLTRGYGLKSEHLCVTYFGGDPGMRLPPDLETKHIWRSIGVPEERLLPGNSKDNFWEMGSSGPCGGCTEIHYLPPHAVSMDNALELWNLVFIEFNREADGSLHKLNQKNVDTGMGFERLVSVLQGFHSNYDTDIFTPLFSGIHRMTRRPPYTGSYGADAYLDTAYRILADHSRMMTVCLADGFYPDQETKLRGIIRKSLTISRNVFDSEENLLQELSTIVAETLGDAYPEISTNLERVHYIIEQEAELLRSLRKSRLGKWKSLCEQQPELSVLSVDECPSLLPAYQKLKESNLPPTQDALPIIWKQCETYGVPQNLAYQLASVINRDLDEQALEDHIAKLKEENRKGMYSVDGVARRCLSSNTLQALRSDGVPVTDDSFKYEYLHGFGVEAEFPDQSSNIVALLVDGEYVNFVSPELLMVHDCEIGVILDRTNMYSEAGGQASDHGRLTLETGEALLVDHVSQNSGYVVHWLHCPVQSQFGLRVDGQCTSSIDKGRRISLMKNHTATHLLNAALRQLLAIVDQKSSRVYPHKLSFDFSVYRNNLDNTALTEVERSVRKVIRQGVAVNRRVIPTNDLHKLSNLTTLPGETYLHNSLSIIEIDSGLLFSREPCCGSHAVNTSSLEDFVITNYKNISSSVKSIQAVTGAEASLARANMHMLRDELKKLEDGVNSLLQCDTNEKEMKRYDDQLAQLIRKSEEIELLSFIEAEKLAGDVEKLRLGLKYSARSTLRLSMEDEMKEVVSRNNLPFLVHNLQCTSKLDSIPLSKATRVSSALPSFIFAGNNGVYKARCIVPQDVLSDKFSAKIWMDAVAQEVKMEFGPPKGQDAALVCNMKAKKFNKDELEKALQIAHNLAANALCSN